MTRHQLTENSYMKITLYYPLFLLCVRGEEESYVGGGGGGKEGGREEGGWGVLGRGGCVTDRASRQAGIGR